MSKFTPNIKNNLVKALTVFFCFYFMTFTSAELGKGDNFTLSKVKVYHGKEIYPRYDEVVAKALAISEFSLTTSCVSLKNEGFMHIRFINHKLRWFKIFAQDIRSYLNEMSRHR